MGVGKATAITAAIVSGMMLAGVRSNVIPRADSSPEATTQAAKRLGPFLNNTDRSDSIADGFQNPEDFAAAVHASRNIRVPFTDLKHQIVDEGKSLPAAIHAVKPTARASLEADLARSEAKADLSAISHH
jgi:hypothetical protein